MNNRSEPRTLGQRKPAATTREAIVTIQANRWATITGIVACNQGAGISTIQVSLAPRGAAHVASQFILYNKAIAVGDSIWITETGLQMAPLDVIRVYSNTGDVSFAVCGVLIAATVAKNG